MRSTATVCAASNVAEAIRRNEEWLTWRVLEYARERGYAGDTPTLEEPWRASIREYSASLLETIERSAGNGLGIGPDEDPEDDPSAALGVVEAKRNRERGISLRSFLCLAKCYRHGYEDLFRRTDLPAGDRERYLHLAVRFFDRFEIAVCVEWSGNSADKNAEFSRLFRQISVAKHEWEGMMDCVGEMVVLTDRVYRIRRCNRAFQQFVGREFLAILGGYCEAFLREKNVHVELSRPGEFEARQEDTGRWYNIHSYPFHRTLNPNDPGSDEALSGNVIILHDVTEQRSNIEEIATKNRMLTEAYNDLKRTQAQVLQQEKMASIGQLAAGVAHEINNPMGFIASNLRTLHKYADRLTGFIDLQDSALKEAAGPPETVRKARADSRIDRIREDMGALVQESLEGAERVRKIVQNLKSFSHVDQAEFKHADINECLNSTINIAWNEIKYKAAMSKDLGKIPLTKCYPQQINQVLMNILLNASHAIEKQGEIRVRTRMENGCVLVSISDTGCGISPAQLGRIFEPFFTTKEIGKGTGLGLSIAYDIVKKHNGEILVESEVGKGSTFTVRIPLVEPL